MINETRKKLFDCFINADRETPVTLLDDFAAKHSYQSAVKDVLEPVLRQFGDEWMKRGNISLAHAYISGKIAEDLLAKTALEYQRNSGLEIFRGIVVIGNIEGDYHSLGRKIVSTFLKSSSWQVHDLGNDVLAEDFVEKALAVNATVIGVSAMMYSNAVNIKKLRDEIDKRNLTGKLQLAVGGAVFNLRPQLVEEVGGDGSAPNAFSSIGLFEILSKKAIQNGGER